MRPLVGCVLLVALAACGTSESGAEAEPTCHTVYDGSYTPLSPAPEPTVSAMDCESSGRDRAYDSTLEIEWDDEQ